MLAPKWCTHWKCSQQHPQMDRLDTLEVVYTLSRDMQQIWIQSKIDTKFMYLHFSFHWSTLFFFFKEYYIHKEQFFLTQVVVVRFPGATGHCGGYLWSCSLNYTQGYVKRWLGPRSLRLARVTQQYFIERGGGGGREGETEIGISRCFEYIMEF